MSADEHWTPERYREYLKGNTPSDDKAVKPRKKPVRHEQNESMALVRWFDLKYPQLRLCFMHIANESSGGPVDVKIRAAMGVRPGASDYLLAVPRGGYHGLFIELKATPPNGAPVRQTQKDCIAAYREQGYKAEVAMGWHEACLLIDDYLQI